MDPEVLQQVLDELFPTLEAMETQNTAILQFLKDRYILSDEDLAPYREKAGNASSVRWLGTRLRVKHILEGAARAAELSQEKKTPPAEGKPTESKPAETGKDQPPAKDQPPKTELDKVEAKPENQEKTAEEKPTGKVTDSTAKADAAPDQQKGNKEETAKSETPDNPGPLGKTPKSTAA
jgi:hypothetical protein